MSESTVYRTGFLDVRQEFSENPADVFGGDFDVALIVPSWDPRSVEVARGSLRFKLAVVPLMTNRGVTDRRNTNEDLLLTYLHSTADEVRTFDATSEDVESTFQAVLDATQEMVKRLDRPLKVFIELTTCPRYLSLGVAALLLRRGWAYQVTFGYTAGSYGAGPETDPFDDVFTVGRWEAIAVPGLEGWHDPGKKRSYVVGVGFEGAKTYRLLASADPDRVAVVFPDPGVQPDYVTRATSENAELLTQYVFGEADVVRAGAADVVATLAAMETAGLENLDEENTFYLTCGSKPQSLALALRAFYLESPAVLYPLPKRHRESLVSALAMHWTYTAYDRSSLFTGVV
jgi:hypothetical protein